MSKKPADVRAKHEQTELSSCLSQAVGDMHPAAPENALDTHASVVLAQALQNDDEKSVLSALCMIPNTKVCKILSCVLCESGAVCTALWSLGLFRVSLLYFVSQSYRCRRLTASPTNHMAGNEQIILTCFFTLVPIHVCILGFHLYVL